MATRPPKSRRKRFTIGAALAAGCVALLVAIYYLAEPPIVLTPVVVRPAGILDFDFLTGGETDGSSATEISRLETVLLSASGPATTGVLAEVSLAPAFEFLAGDKWTKTTGAIMLPGSLDNQPPSLTNCIACLVPKGSKACRFRVDYYSALPLGIGSPVARYLPPGKGSEWAQKGIGAVSQSLYAWLWPQRTSWKVCLKTKVVEVALPKGYTKDETLFPDL